MASSLDCDLSCPVCHEIFKDPVLLSCNHSCCRECLKTWWTDKPLKLCPVCKLMSSTDNPPLNWDLKNLCDVLMEDSRECLCPLHSEKLKLFCLDHEQPVCLICRDSGSHRNHRFSPIEEVLPDLRGKLQRSLGLLKDRLKGLNKSKDQFSTAAAHIRAQAQLTEKQIQGQFRKLHQSLKDEEEARLKAVREEERQKTKKATDTIAAMSRDIAALTQTITATEEQLRATDKCFVLGYKDAVERVERGILLEDPQLGPRALLDQAKHVGNMAFNIWSNMKKMVHFSPIVLDPNTAHPELMMSEDLSSVGRTKMLNLPQNPERFTGHSRVLGWGGFSTGSHSWMVKVPNDAYWVVGVISESVLKRGQTMSGFWSLFVSKGNYRVYAASGTSKALKGKKKLETVRVKLNFGKGKLSFYNADTKKLLHTFTHAFKERLFPYFETHSDVKMKILRASQIEINMNYH